MMSVRGLLLLLTLAIALAGCGKSEKARQELAQLNLEYTDATFIDSARHLTTAKADIVDP